MTTTDPSTTNGTNAAPPAAAPPPAQPSTALAPRPVAPPPAPDTGGTIDVFASAANFGVAQRMAMGLASSTMVPEAYRSKTFGQKGEPTDTMALGNCMIAIELASRIGASVFAVMQNLDIIHGRPGWRSTFLIATVNACGRFNPLRFRFEGAPGSDEWGCRAVAKDRESGEELVGSLITIGLARAEGWSTKSGSKWKTMPEQMLCYRAAAFWTRIYAPELSIGMSTADEVADMAGAPGPDVGSSFAPSSAKTLTERLMAQPDPVATVTSPSAPISTPAVVPVVVAETKATPPAAEPPAEPKTTKKGGKAAAQAALPTGDLLAAKPGEVLPPGYERDPLTHEIVPPPAREPGDDSEELGE